MDNESTLLINNEPPVYNGTVTDNPAPASKKSSNAPKIAGAAAGGFVAGAAAAAGVSAVASPSATIDEVMAEAEAEAEAEETGTTPQAQDALLVNGEGIHFAHVEADNFNSAFAQAREQVGPGGAFEYHGQLYSTYYAEEWDAMTPEERADHRHDIMASASTHTAAPASSNHADVVADYVLPADGGTVEHQNITVNVVVNNVAESAEPTDVEANNLDLNPDNSIDVDPVIVVDNDIALVEGTDESVDIIDNEIRILGVDVVDNVQGEVMAVAMADGTDTNTLLIDVNDDGGVDLLVDDAADDPGLFADVEGDFSSDADIMMQDVEDYHATPAEQGDFLLAADDGMPDYINDADSMMMA